MVKEFLKRYSLAFGRLLTQRMSDDLREMKDDLRKAQEKLSSLDEIVHRFKHEMTGHDALKIHNQLSEQGYGGFRGDFMGEMYKRVASETADYIMGNMPKALEFQNRQKLWNLAIGNASLDGLFLEFGVFEGESINYMAEQFPSKFFYGFDSFEGLQEDWEGGGAEKGFFSLQGRIPYARENVHLIKGWFHETLPHFLQEHKEVFSFVHIDCDTYPATKTVFDMIGTRIMPKTTIVFDDYMGYRGWRNGNYRAWQEFVAQNTVHYDYIGFSTHNPKSSMGQVAVRVNSISHG